MSLFIPAVTQSYRNQYVDRCALHFEASARFESSRRQTRSPDELKALYRQATLGPSNPPLAVPGELFRLVEKTPVSCHLWGRT